MTFIKRLSDRDRFMSFVSPEPNSGCWLWAGAVNDSGYGIFGVNGGCVSAHRWIMRQIHGDLSFEQKTDHKCRVRCCVNPDHLEIVTNQENVRRAVPFGTIGRRNREKTACKHGHPLSGANVAYRMSGGALRRRCRECKRLEDAARHIRAMLKLKARGIGSGE